MRTSIQYEDKHIIVVYKPAGLATQTAKVGQPDVVSELKNHLKGGYVGVVHRLDQPVEGLLVFGKTKEATAALATQLSKGVLNKHYRAVVCGKPDTIEGVLVDYLTKTPDNRAQVVEAPEGKRAVLKYRILNGPGPDISLVDIQIDTGRFHQIRVQMAHAGLPLLGDQKYGTKQSMQLSHALNVRNVALCARDITLKHPVSGKQLAFEVEPKGAIFEQVTMTNSTSQL